MTTSDVLQRRTEATRAELSTTLDELRLSMTGAALMGGATAMAREGSATVARAVLRRAGDNPLAALLIGAGVVMLCTRSSIFPLGAGRTTDTAPMPGGQFEAQWIKEHKPPGTRPTRPRPACARRRRPLPAQ